MTRPWLLAGLVACAAMSDAARADDFWGRSTGDRDEARAIYAAAMELGDDNARNALRVSDPSAKRRLAEVAASAYDRAVRADPTRAEPHYRAAEVLYRHTVEPRGAGVNRDEALRVIAYWKEFERLAPLDPRLERVLNDRALLHTRLATAESFELALADYQRLTKMSDINDLPRAEAARRLGNMAEIYMMTGRLDEAITVYEASMELDNDATHAYGLAVALDRYGLGDKAREVMRRHTSEALLQEFVARVKRQQNVFYVPAGEEHYYVALALDTLGFADLAAAEYGRFVASGAHPAFHNRARHHIRELEKRSAKRGHEQAKPPWLEQWENPAGW